MSLEQLHHADLELFKHLMSETRDGIRARADGTFPLEDALKICINLPHVRLHLQPLQGGSERKAEEAKPSKEKDSDSEEKARMKRQIQSLKDRTRNSPKPSSSKDHERGGGGKPKKGKGEGEGKGGGVRMPLELVGMESSWDGEPICFDYNLSGCSKAKEGQKCGK